MAQQYGFRASSNLLEVLNRDKCWDNLGVDRRDLPLLVGTSAAGVTASDYQAIIGLTDGLENQIVTTTSGAFFSIFSLSSKISKNGDTILGNVFANVINNDRPYYDAANTIYGPSTASFFSPANAVGFSSGAQYKLGPVGTTTTTVSGLDYAGTALPWSNFFVRYKQYLRVQEQPSWTTRRSPLYLPPPSTLPSNVLWLDSEYSSFQLEGGAVVQWRDVLQRATAAQPVSGSRPLRVANRLSGKPGIVFDGTNDFLSLGDIGGRFPSAATVIVVATLGETIARGDTNYNLIGTLNNTGNRWRSGTGNGSLGLFTSTIQTGFPESMPANGTYIFSVQASQELGITLRINSLETRKRSNQFIANITYDPGTVYTIGANANGGAGFLTGTIYAIAMFDTVLSEKELRTEEEYFAWRFDYVYDPDRSQTVELEDENPLDTEGGAAFTLG